MFDELHTILGTAAQFIVVQDGLGYTNAMVQALNNLIHERRLPAMLAINSGGGDAQGNQRGLFLSVSMTGRGWTGEVSNASLHNWVLANQPMAAALKAKGYAYCYLFSEAAGHTDRRMTRQTSRRRGWRRLSAAIESC